MKYFRSCIKWVLGLSVISACNLYTPFNTNTSDLDKLEEAQKCLNDEDYICAIQQYQEIKDTNLKNQKLCQAYLTKGGLKLEDLVNTLNKNSGTVLSNLAKELMPWTPSRSEDFDTAQTHCSALSASTGSDAIFLKTVGAFTRCAYRMAKADVLKGSSNSSCNLTGLSDGLLTSSDIGGDGAGALSGANPGMCKTDVDTCRSDMVLLSESELSSAGYTDLAGAIDKLPSGITNSSTDTVRAALRGTF